jgi:hypothetical protein
VLEVSLRKRPLQVLLPILPSSSSKDERSYQIASSFRYVVEVRRTGRRHFVNPFRRFWNAPQRVSY